jgi:membrane protease YdiL (CAAX protease family)
MVVQLGGLLGDWTSALIPLIFLGVPWWLLDRRRADWSAYALTPQPVARGLILTLVLTLAVFPLFFVAFLLYYGTACDLGLMPRMCHEYLGASGAALRWPPGFLEQILAQVVAVALPEEFFFRGYLQGRLAEVWPDRRRMWGAPVGRALVVSAVLFAVGHVLVDGNLLRLAVFFPALVFGWMRARTGSILPGVLFHAMCNLYSDVLHRSFFG